MTHRPRYRAPALIRCPRGHPPQHDTGEAVAVCQSCGCEFRPVRAKRLSVASMEEIVDQEETRR